MCKQCDTNPVYEFTNQRKLCRSCFIKYFQKKVLYTIRKFGMIRNGDIIGFADKKDFRSVVLKEILEIAEKRANVKIVKLPSKKTNKITVPLTLDSEAEDIVNAIIEKNLENQNVSPVENKIIKPLYLFLDEEVLLYAKLRNLRFNKKKEKKNKLSEFIGGLEKKHPEIKRAIVNSYLKIKEN
jgi:tRNA(Ile)-lysidine synthase TilS/MesJ